MPEELQNQDRLEEPPKIEILETTGLETTGYSVFKPKNFLEIIAGDILVYRNGVIEQVTEVIERQNAYPQWNRVKKQGETIERGLVDAMPPRIQGLEFVLRKTEEYAQPKNSSKNLLKYIATGALSAITAFIIGVGVSGYSKKAENSEVNPAITITTEQTDRKNLEEEIGKTRKQTAEEYEKKISSDYVAKSNVVNNYVPKSDIERIVEERTSQLRRNLYTREQLDRAIAESQKGLYTEEELNKAVPEAVADVKKGFYIQAAVEEAAKEKPIAQKETEPIKINNIVKEREKKPVILDDEIDPAKWEWIRRITGVY